METLSCQPLLDRLTGVIVKTGAIKQFEKKKTCLEKVTFCYKSVFQQNGAEISIKNEIQQLLDALYETSDKHKKSEDLALIAKTNGSKAYCQKEDKKAMALYTDCIRLAPTSSSILPLAFANRSAVLLKMNLLQNCLDDILIAEDLNYPKELLHKILIRKSTVLIKLNKFKEARTAIERLSRHVLMMPNNGKDELVKSLSMLHNNLASAMECHEEMSVPIHEVSSSLYGGESSNVMFMTKYFDIRYNEEEGRHIVANAMVPKGSVVFKETPFATILLPEYFHTHCYHCLDKKINPIPCTGCRDIVYCDNKCRTASSGWHKYECGHLHILTSVGIAHLALRNVLTAGWNLCSTIRKEDYTCAINGMSTDGVYNNRDITSGYRAVYHLLTHFDDALPEDQVQYALASIFLATAICDTTKLFQDWQISSHNDENTISVEKLSSLIMHHMVQLVTNAHAVTQVTPSGTDPISEVDHVSQVRIASAIYATASIMNHSCKPSVINSYQKSTLLVHTIEDINTGDKIFNSYGPHYCRQVYEDRQNSLKQQYFFKCECTECQDPQRRIEEASWSGMKCEKCYGVMQWCPDNKDANNQQSLLCLECRQFSQPSFEFFEHYQKANEFYENGNVSYNNGDFNEAAQLLQEAARFADLVYHQNNEFLNHIKDVLVQSYVISGEFKKASNELLSCLTYIENRYGEDCVELGHEYLKYVGILMKDQNSSSGAEREKKIQEVNKIIERIFIINYGKCWKSYLQINYL